MLLQARSVSSIRGLPLQGRSVFSPTGLGRIEGAAPASQMEILTGLKDLGIPSNEENAKLCRNIGEALEHYRELREIRTSLPYEIDGTVIKVNSLADQSGARFEDPLSPLGSWRTSSNRSRPVPRYCASRSVWAAPGL